MNSSIYLYKSPIATNEVCISELEARFKDLKVDPARVVPLPDASYLGKVLPEERGILVLPGGSTCIMLEDISAQVDSIKKAVDRGWNYLGFCAGANVACQNLLKLNWQKQKFDNIGQDLVPHGYHFLQLLPVWAQMPVYGLQTGDKVVKVAANNETFSCFWSDGAKFMSSREADTKVSILAQYDDQVHKPVAALSGMYGKGKVVISAVHPEICLDHAIKADQKRHAFLQHLFTSVGI